MTVTKKAPAPPLPGVCEGDELFAHVEGKPVAGRVLCHGRHGVTLRVADKEHKVYWNDVLGHKSRAASRVMVVEGGDDGAIVEDARGRRTFVAGYESPIQQPVEVEERERLPGPMTKALPLLLLFTEDGAELAKAMGGGVKNRPGLALQDVTDRAGHHTKRWKRTSQEKPGEKRYARHDDGAGGKPPRHEDSLGGSRSAGEGYGTHNLEAGDSVDFKIGELAGSGKIIGRPGKDGAHVEDSTGHQHKVLWSQVTGHKPADGGKKPPAEPPNVLGSQEPIPPDRFSATEFAKSHDQADVTPESVLKSFPSDTESKIQETQRRLQSVEQTIDKFKRDGKYDAERKKLHNDILFNGVDKIVDGKKKRLPGILSPERVAAATPADGEQPRLVLLGGRGGSGKSWFKGQVYDPNKFIVLDADAIKEMLPEYEGWNASQVHEESGELFDKIADLARERHLNVVLDSTMKTPKGAIDRLNAFKDEGYATEAHYMHLPRQEAAKRAVSRFLGKTNRYVPVDVVLSNTSNEHSFDQIKGMVDKWSFRDNNVPEKTDPILISDSEGKAGADPAGDKAAAEPLKKTGGDATMKDGG